MNEILHRVEKTTRLKGYTMKKMCEEINIPYRAWCGYKNRDADPPIHFIKAFCKKFNITSDEIIFGEDVPEQNYDVNPQLQILARHLDDIPEKQRERIYNHFADTIDIYLSKK